MPSAPPRMAIATNISGSEIGAAIAPNASAPAIVLVTISLVLPSIMLSLAKNRRENTAAKARTASSEPMTSTAMLRSVPISGR